jgi:chromosome segregation ATPase
MTKAGALKAKDVPATQGMLRLVKTELVSEMDSRFLKVDAQFKKVDARFSEIDARFKKIDARFSEIDAKLNRLEARIDELTAIVHHMAAEMTRMMVMNEEQNSRNQIVLEGLSGLYHRQERSETRMAEVERLVHALARSGRG